VAVAVPAAGCRDAEEAVRARDRRVELTQTDFRWRPQLVRAPAGELTFAVVNRARLPHNLRVEGRGREWARLSALKPGERDQVRAKLPPGDYRLLCSIANHEELGMYGTLVVR
jgi:plastocyanin